MKLETINVIGFEGAVLGMRLPMCLNLEDVKSKSDSTFNDDSYALGEKDLQLARKLINADKHSESQPNSKFLRMIHVQVAITAPLFWWKEADTYKTGTVANSTSTMHKLASTPITRECFENGNYIIPKIIEFLEGYRQNYNETKDRIWWDKLIVNLPESWLQTRMFDCDYATLRNIYHWRKNHKLQQWHVLCDWIKTLPYFKELIDE